MVRMADNPFQRLLRKQQRAKNRSTFGEGAREHSHGASLGAPTVRRRCEEEAAGQVATEEEG